MRLSRPRLLTAAVLALVGAAAAGVAVSSMRSGGPDLAYLDNFELPPSVEQQLADARARGIEGDIHIPDAQLPPPWLEPQLHGPFLLEPNGWTGALPPDSDARPFATWDTPAPTAPLTDADIRASALWREPSAVPDGFTLRDVASERLGHAVTQHWSRPVEDEPGLEEVIELQWWEPQYLPVRIGTWADGDTRLFEPTTIEGSPAVVYRDAHGGATVWLFNEGEGVVYVGQSTAVTSDNLIAMVRSLYQ